MADIVLRDIDELLAARIRRVSERHGWSLGRTLQHLLEQGLYHYDGDGRTAFDNSEAEVLQAAIAALEHIPDAAFSRIGQVDDDDDDAAGRG